MTKRFLLGLTGGIGAGKTLALKEFARLGAETVSADEIALRVRVRIAGKLAKAFGTTDRAKLGRIVFADPKKRKVLERMTHPLIMRELLKKIRKAKGLCVADVPLLFEGGHQKLFDATLLVVSRDAKRINRIVRRDGLSRSQALRRLRAQMPQKRKAVLADVVIENDGNRAEFLRKLRPYHKGLELLRQGGD